MHLFPWSRLVTTQVSLSLYPVPSSINKELSARTLGHFTKALVQVSPGQNLLGFGSMMSWNEWVVIWSRVHGVKCRFERLDRKIIENSIPGGVGEELADMFDYISDFGYDGGDPSVVYPKDASHTSSQS